MMIVSLRYDFLFSLERIFLMSSSSLLVWGELGVVFRNATITFSGACVKFGPAGRQLAAVNG